jgi:hypothetical protein
MPWHVSYRRRAHAGPIVVGLALLGSVLFAGSSATAQEPPFTRGIDAACPAETRTPDRFPDVAGTVHREAINCIAAYQVTLGRSGPDGPVYDPGSAVTREQMATFIARAIEATGEELPLGDPFPDVGDTHADNVRKLVAAGVAEGRADGTFGPELPVTRAQMASFIARAIETVTGDELSAASVFPDVSGTHATNIGKLAAVGIVAGREDGTYGPDEPVTRAQMASFLARSLAEFVDRGTPPELPEPPANTVVGSFTTPLQPGQARNDNIHLAADYIDGDVIPAGSSYSLNQGIGERTSARGFGPNGYIDGDGDVISVIGGGVSQMGTTFLNAAWFTGIQIDEFRQHTIYFPRYPMCREATLDWGTLDVVVTNDSPYDITIDTGYSSESVTVTFLSEPWAEVETTISEPYDVGGVGGPFTVDCDRTVTYPDGTSASESYTWRYNEGYPG